MVLLKHILQVFKAFHNHIWELLVLLVETLFILLEEIYSADILLFVEFCVDEIANCEADVVSSMQVLVL